MIPSELDKEKLRRAEDLIAKKDAEIGSLRSSLSTLKAKVENLTDQVFGRYYVQPIHHGRGAE